MDKSETCLTNHTRPISYHITPLVINALGGGHTHTSMREPKQFQETRRAHPGLKVFKRILLDNGMQ